MEKLSKSPLVMVLAQVRFAPVLQIQKFIPDLQEELRKNGFPHFVEEQVQELVFGGTVPPVRSSSRWIFGAPDWRKTVVFSQDFVVIETSDYDRFETFSNEFEKILNLAKEKIDLGRSERIGLRYVNLIRGQKSKSPYLFLRQEMRGFSAVEFGDVKSVQSTCLSQAITDVGRLLVRAVHTDDGSHIPPELASTKLQFPDKPKPGEQISFLDIDHNGEFPGDFDVSALIAELGKLHQYSDITFEKAVTPEALELWK